jgi:hypothetical protein
VQSFDFLELNAPKIRILYHVRVRYIGDHSRLDESDACHEISSHREEFDKVMTRADGNPVATAWGRSREPLTTERITPA